MPSQDAIEGASMHPALPAVQRCLSDALATVRMPPLPALNPDALQERGAGENLTDADAYIVNSLRAAVWGQCMIGLDFMHGITATIAAPTYLSAAALARTALESFAMAFWVADDRQTTDEKYHRALLLNRELVEQEQKRGSRALRSQGTQDHEFAQAFNDRLQLIESGIAHFGERLEDADIRYPSRLPSRSDAVRNILRDVSPIPDSLYGTLSAVTHGDAIFVYNLLSPHPDRVRPPNSEQHVVLSTTVTNHLTPVWHAAVAMCIAMEVAQFVLEIDYDRNAMIETSQEIMRFVVQHGDEPIWQPSDGSRGEAG